MAGEQFYYGHLVPVERPERPERPDRPAGGWGGRPPDRPHPGEPEYPDAGLPPDPPGVWPPLEGPSFPIFPVPPGEGDGGEGPWEPGEIWPPIRPPLGELLPPTAGQPLPKNLCFAACYLTGYGWRWIVVDLNAIHRPEPPAGGIGGRPPNTRPLPPREPKA
jgi:hypothetical protein